ncbi:MAG: glycosyltransferase family 4 protein [Anaerolineales bacterium]|nr:glycosyltransferase family 4 protein [Anaerolineales bacterium]
MKIGVIHLGRRGSGGPISIELATHLSKKTKVFAFISEYSECITAWEQTDLPLEKVRTYRSTIQAFISYLNNVRFRMISKQIRCYKPDVLLFPMFFTWNPFLQRHLQDIPAVIAIHDPIPHPGLSGFVFRYLEDWSIQLADRYLLFSRIFESDLHKRGAQPEAIDYVPTGALSYYQRYSSSEGKCQSNITNLLFLGRITAYKGLDVLLDAYGEVSKRHPVRLSIIGEGNLRPYETALSELVNLEIVNHWIKDVEIDNYLRNADIVLLPYTQTSQSGVLDLAAAYGRPVIATKVGGIPEQIKDGETGLLIDSDSTAQLVNAIEQLLLDPEYASRLGNNLQKDYAENRNWDTIAEIVLNACQKAVNGRNLSKK